MLQAVSKLSPDAAIGYLARAALASYEGENPAAALRTGEEKFIRAAIYSEVKHALGIRIDDNSPEALEKVGDVIDLEVDNLVGKTDDQKVLLGLADKGQAPSDVYDVTIIQQVQTLYKDNWDREYGQILETIRDADQEQHFGPDAKDGDPSLVSLFAKVFPNEFPYRTFTLLVATHREGLRLFVHQVWHIYQDEIPIKDAANLIDVLRRFADRFGVEFEINNMRAKFLLNVEIPVNRTLTRSIKIMPLFASDSKGRQVQKQFDYYLSDFLRTNKDETKTSALTLAINLDKYLAYLNDHKWLE